MLISLAPCGTFNPIGVPQCSFGILLCWNKTQKQKNPCPLKDAVGALACVSTTLLLLQISSKPSRWTDTTFLQNHH